MDNNRAIEYGLLIRAAYDIKPSNLKNAVGTNIDAAHDPYGRGYKIVGTIYGVDETLQSSVTDDPGDEVSFGLVVQDDNANLVVALRGTEGEAEWISNGMWNLVGFPFVDNSGRVHSGFELTYARLFAKENYGANRIVFSLISLPTAEPKSLTICGHSLGGALATMLAVDAVANTKFKQPSVYLFASPRVGNGKFVARYNELVPNTNRIVNVCDLVPKVPPAPLYQHVASPINLMPNGITPEESCWHDMRTYLYLLSQGAAVEHPQPIADLCAVR